MKKNQILLTSDSDKIWRSKLCRSIRIALFVVFAAVSQVFATDLYSQDTRLSLDMKNTEIKNVLQVIENRTQFVFMYNAAQIGVTDKVSIQCENKSVPEILDVLFCDTNVTFDINNRQIALTVVESNSSQQARTVSGRVTDSADSPLPGVTIVIKGTNNQGTATDFEGNFIFDDISENTVLVFSFIGYQAQEVAVNNRSFINVVLQATNTELDEVVVTALGIERKEKSLVYSAQMVKPKEMIEIPDPNNFLNTLQGKVSNALITQSLGGVGSDVSIILRGNRSIQRSNNALIVIDGVPSNFSTPNINPNDIASITVLKGAAAGTLYGSEAGNGAIIITTKKGDANNVKLNINSGTNISFVYGLPSVQNTYGQGSNGVLDPMQGSSWGPKMEGQTYTDYKGNQSNYSSCPDNIKDFFSSSVNFTNSVSASGGSEKVQGYMSYLNETKTGVVPANKLISHNLNMRITANISDRFSVDGNFTLLCQNIKDDRRSLSRTYAILALQIPRNIPHSYAKDFEIIDDTGVPAPLYWPTNDTDTYQNPYWSLNRGKESEKLEQTSGYFKAKYKITPWLNVVGNVNLSKTFTLTDTKIWQGTSYNPPSPGGTYIRNFNMKNQRWLDIIFDGTNDITPNLKVNYQFGGIYKDNKSESEELTAQGLYIENKFSLNYAITQIIESGDYRVQTQSVFGQANLSFKEFLFLDASLRNDWVSVLPAPHSFQYYSLGTSAILSSMFALPKSISYLKTSINYAEVGNGGSFGLLASNYSYSRGAGYGNLTRSWDLPFKDLKPEIVKNLELNTELKLLQNNLTFEFTYYKSNSFNQLLSLNAPTATGYGTRYINAGNIRNRGVELSLGGDAVRTRDFSWNISLNYSCNRNKIIKLHDKLKKILNDDSNSASIQIAEGGSYGDIYAPTWKKNSEGEYLVNPEGLPLTTDRAGDDRTVIGNFNPKALVGLTNTFNYKNFSSRVLIDGRIGGVVISGVDMDMAFDGTPEFTSKYREGGWNLGGVDTNGEKVTAAIDAQRFWQWVSIKRYGVAEFFAYDATNFRIREVTFGYDIPLSNNSFIKSAHISLVARNLFFLYRGSTKLDIPGIGKRKMWFDPDMTGGGIQNQFKYIPSLRNIGLNINLTF
jgi:TonB-linked SusC/RagA family outer membrane protein